MSSERAFLELLANQYGIGTIRQADVLGLTRHRVHHLVKVGRLKQLEYGIVAAAGAPETYERSLMLGVLLAATRCRDAIVTGAICDITAAFLLDLVPETEEPIHVLSTRRLRSRDGYRFKHTSRLPEDEIVEVRGIKCTDHIRTFLDLCHSHPHRAKYIYKRGLRSSSFTSEVVVQRIDREARQGRAGVCLARTIVESTNPTAAIAKSGKEDHYFELLVDSGYPPPLRNHKVRGSYGHDWELDLFFPQMSVGIEISPYDTHMDFDVSVRDGRKELDLEALGIRVLRITDGLTDAEFKRHMLAILGAPYSWPQTSEVSL